ncbi:DUF1036 domain-containing protein [Pseudaminobacter arsenicus]|uniref:DUF1036 domain-containing protein n=1 Tax=Borborobacter arsenicus TaxID=1851146 RepID=A0A432V7E0_9HYPH|nr:DUF1036 domain-containing protein [Pseudaminobacter arsenicus]RUM97993.1 DUF1036 domain-containing protein [Pseudaminobacter arsenicus]
MKKTGWKLIVVALSAIAWTEAGAQEIKVCNNGEAEVSYAILATTSLVNLGDPEWTAHGWYMMKPGECQPVTRGDGRREAFLSVRSINKDGLSSLNSYVIKDIPASNFSDNSLSTGAERVFCVSSSSFRRPEKSLQDHESCPQGYHEQVFNLYFFSRGMVDFTVNLK